MKRLLAPLLFLTIAAPVFAAGSGTPPLTAAEHINLTAYSGRWYEQRRLANQFQDNHPDGLSICHGTYAEYTLLPNGEIDVANTCDRFNDAGVAAPESVRGVARVVSGSGGAKLRVNFTGSSILRGLGIGTGDYWIIAVGPIDEDTGFYTWALVSGGNDRSYAWILSREARMENDALAPILDLASQLGFDRNAFVEAY